MKFTAVSALVIALLAANTQKLLLWKTVNPTSSTNFAHLLVAHATVAQTEYEANILCVARGLINRSVGTCV